MGIGSGLKGYENNKRAEKTKWLEEQTAGILKLDMQLKSQMQEQQQQQQQLSGFIKQALPSITQLSQANLAGDQQAADLIGRNILQTYKGKFNDPTVGDYTGQRNGTIYYVNPETGNEEGRNIGQFLFQAGLDPNELFGPDTGIVLAGLSPGGRSQYEKSELMDQYALQGASLKNQGIQADINYRNAQIADLQYRQSPESMKNSPEARALTKDNMKYVQDTVLPKIDANNGFLQAYEAMDNILNESPNIIGSDLKTKAYRSFAEQFGLEPNIDYERLTSVEFEKQLKPILGAQLGEKEGERLLRKFTSSATNPKALRRFLDDEMPKVVKNLIVNERIRDAFNEDPTTNLFSRRFSENVDQDVGTYLSMRSNDTQNVKKAYLESKNTSSGIKNNPNPANNNFDSLIQSLGGERLK